MQSTLASPAADVQPVLMTLMSELDNVVGEQLQLVPNAIQMAIQLQLLQQQWQTLAGLQQAAVAAGDPAMTLSWSVFEQYMMEQLRGMFCRLQPAMEAWQGLYQQQQQSAQLQQPAGGQEQQQEQQSDEVQDVATGAQEAAAAPTAKTVSFFRVSRRWQLVDMCWQYTYAWIVAAAVAVTLVHDIKEDSFGFFCSELRGCVMASPM
jgi:hypothetical protein